MFATGVWALVDTVSARYTRCAAGARRLRGALTARAARLAPSRGTRSLAACAALAVGVWVAWGVVRASSVLEEVEALNLTRVCGNFCGPGWCAGRLQSEDVCNASSVAPEPGSCPDRCCQAHDGCCHDGADRLTSEAAYAHCNARIVACLNACAMTGDMRCTTADDTNFPLPLIDFVMTATRDLHMCCGGPCP